MLKFSECLILFVLVFTGVGTIPLSHDRDRLTSGFSRLGAIAPRLEGKQEPRLLLSTPQQLEALKKVAQVLVMLGEQVIPAIIGNIPGVGLGLVGSTTNAPEVPNDPVHLN